LQHDRPLLLAASKENRSLPIAKLSPPRSARHPWDELLRGLPNAPPAEPVAAAVPAEFWYARAADLPSLFVFADQLDAWGTPAAIERVLDAVDGKRARLADEMDFRYMLGRDAADHHPLLFFLGDRFISEVIGPRQKILEARRQLAAAELMTPGFAALLYGWLH